MDHLSYRRICCASAYLGSSGVMAWHVLGVPWSKLCQFCQTLDFLLEAPLRLLWAFSCTLALCVLGVFLNSFLAHSGCSLVRLPVSLLLREILFARSAQRPREPLGTSLLAWDRVVLSLHLLSCLLQNFLTCSWLSYNSDRLMYFPYHICCYGYTFWSSERHCGLEVVLNIHPYSLLLSDVSVPVTDLCWRRRRGTFLVLEMEIHHPSYLLFYWLVI